MGKKNAKRKSAQEFIFKKVIFFSIASVVLLIGLSFITQFVGDRLLLKDNIYLAELFYKFSKLTNPLNGNLDKRLLATEIIGEERRTHSEETDANESEISIGNVKRSVLGESVTVPVLMYHYIRVNPNQNDKVGYSLSVTPSNFSTQMDYLAAHGYHTISLDEMGAALLSHAALPQKPIVITFDDGYADCHDTALPILQSHGFKAVNFVITGLVGAPNYLTWGQIDEMKNSGVFTFGSHTITHRALYSLDNKSIKTEVTESKDILQSNLGYPINWFAYPYGAGAFDSRVSNIVRQAGYIGAFGTNYGANQNTDYMFRLPRVRVNGSDNVSSFASKLPWR